MLGDCGRRQLQKRQPNYVAFNIAIPCMEFDVVHPKNDAVIFDSVSSDTVDAESAIAARGSILSLGRPEFGILGAPANTAAAFLEESNLNNAATVILR